MIVIIKNLHYSKTHRDVLRPLQISADPDTNETENLLFPCFLIETNFLSSIL